MKQSLSDKIGDTLGHLTFWPFDLVKGAPLPQVVRFVLFVVATPLVLFLMVCLTPLLLLVIALMVWEDMGDKS